MSRRRERRRAVDGTWIHRRACRGPRARAAPDARPGHAAAAAVVRAGPGRRPPPIHGWGRSWRTRPSGPSSMATSACCWRGRRTSISRPSGSLRPSRPRMSSTACRRCRGCVTGAPIGSWTSARAAAIPDCRSRRPAGQRVHPGRADRQEGAIPPDRGRGDGTGRSRDGPHGAGRGARSGPGSPAHRGPSSRLVRWHRRPISSSSPFRCWTPAGRWWPGSAAISTPSSRPLSGRSTRSVVARSRCARSPWRGSRITGS